VFPPSAGEVTGDQGQSHLLLTVGRSVGRSVSQSVSQSVLASSLSGTQNQILVLVKRVTDLFDVGRPARREDGSVM